ncbi:MAG: helix-turn-helix transcriptional regulator [Clostridia bacterium]|nr:helix-turn-helix transcriptional regulator [Clostridia bacterium]
MFDHRNFPKITLAAARVNAGLSQEQAANILETTKETVSNYERGKSTPNWDMVKKIEAAYNFPSDFIIFGEQLRLKRNDTQSTT